MVGLQVLTSFVNLGKALNMNLIEELKWRNMVQDIMPGTEEQFSKEMTTAYAGFDPTADSLHIGNLVPIMLLQHIQKAGHKPIALVGGATGMIGDPSGKSAERNLLSLEVLNHNLECQRKQLEQFLDFDCGENAAEIVNNYDWFKEFNLLDFLRDVGKHLTISYMVAKDSVQNRLETGLSFTEFSYQLIQGYDFYWLYENMNCKVQVGGSDQWGNITSGAEFIRRKAQGEAFAFTCPLITKADGSKFGKSEGGNVWLDPEKTSPYQFYQFWVTTSDEDAANYIKIFTMLDKETIEGIIEEHSKDPGAQGLQKALAREITTTVHSKEACDAAIEASQILFMKGEEAIVALGKLDDRVFMDIFNGVPQAEVSKTEIQSGLNILDALAGKTGFLQSNGEARRALKENSVSVNMQKVDDQKLVGSEDLINDKYILLQRGKKKKFLIKAV